MSLKVLLADESSTIKKAFQLALGEFAPEIKSVPSGLDVLSVSQEFEPDIIFADVLLTKKSGYEVCKEIKAHPLLKSTPVILMWSSFMEFDQNLAQNAGYDDRIEKPFDTHALKEKINKFVKKTNSHPLKNMIEAPRMPQFDESESIFRQKNLYSQQKNELVDNSAYFASEKSQTKKIPVLDNYTEVDLNTKTNTLTIAPSHHQSEASSTTQDPYDIHIETENYGDFEEVILVKNEKTQIKENALQKNIHSYLEDSMVSLNKAQNQGIGQAQGMSKFDQELMREEVRLMAEKICWQIIPEITEKIVREELSKLMSQIEKSI